MAEIGRVPRAEYDVPSPGKTQELPGSLHLEIVRPGASGGGVECMKSPVTPVC